MKVRITCDVKLLAPFLFVLHGKYHRQRGAAGVAPKTLAVAEMVSAAPLLVRVFLHRPDRSQCQLSDPDCALPVAFATKLPLNHD